jgi:hypothetical protein
MFVELPLWLLAMASTVFPVAVLSAASARMAIRYFSWPPLITASAVAPVLAAMSAFAFGWYMTELVPAVNWWNGWWMPVAASLSTILLEAIAVRRTSTAAKV